MRKIPLTLAVVATACLALASCSKEIKPNKKGAFIVSNKKLIELPAVAVETTTTSDGFFYNYFQGEPEATLRGDDYIILYGDYKPTALNPYKRGPGYFEQDSAKPTATDSMTIQPMAGKKDMFKCRLTKPVAAGVYLLECQAGNASVGFPFRIE
jgi:hypothetical protein